jgi:3' exoribonuclease, RNase T-like
MALTDCMIDLETLATSTDAAILTIGAVKFDPFGKDIEEPEMDSFYVKVDLDSCHELGLVTNDDTIAWWANQSKEAQDEAFGTEGRVHIKDAFDQLYKFCWGAQRVWSNGSVFDIMICEHVFKKLNKAVPWQFWQIRDCRTAYDLGIDAKRPPVTAHHALQDAWNQAVGIQNVYNTLRTSTTNDGNYITPFAKTK